MKSTQLEIIESTDDKLNGFLLDLKQTKDMYYTCLKTKIIVIDTHNEVEQMIKEYEDTGSMVFWDLHLTVILNNALIFIDKVSFKTS